MIHVPGGGIPRPYRRTVNGQTIYISEAGGTRVPAPAAGGLIAAAGPLLARLGLGGLTRGGGRAALRRGGQYASRVARRYVRRFGRGLSGREAARLGIGGPKRRRRTILTRRDVQGARRVAKVIREFGMTPKRFIRRVGRRRRRF